jgi:hypothetical protein
VQADPTLTQSVSNSMKPEATKKRKICWDNSHLRKTAYRDYWCYGNLSTAILPSALSHC